MSYTAREFSHAAKTAKKWLLLLLQKYRGKTLHQSLWGEIRGIRSCRSHSELRKHQLVEEEDICVVSTKNICRSCCLHDGILIAFCTVECTLKHQKYTHRKRQRFHLHLLLQQANDHFSRRMYVMYGELLCTQYILYHYIHIMSWRHTT